MSDGKLCSKRFVVSRSINTSNDVTLECDLYEGHEGDHSQMFYHTVKVQGTGDHHNYRIGRINWKQDENIYT